MINKLWVARSFLHSHLSRYAVTGSCGTEKVLVEIDPFVTFLLPEEDPERALMNMRARIQEAAPQTWEGGEASYQASRMAGAVPRDYIISRRPGALTTRLMMLIALANI